MKLAVLVAVLSIVLCFSHVQGAVVSTADHGSDGVNFGTALKAYYVAIIKMLRCGYAPYGIPVWEPYTVKHYDYDYSNDYVNISGNFSNIMISGVEKLTILNMDFNNATNETYFDIIYPQLHLLGEYKVKSRALMAGLPVTMVGDGIFDWKVVDLRVVGKFKISPLKYNPWGLHIHHFDMKMYIGDTVSYSWNNQWDIATNNFINTMLPDSIQMWIEHNNHLLTELFQNNTLPMLNDVLQYFDMQQVIAFLQDQTTAFTNAANC